MGALKSWNPLMNYVPLTVTIFFENNKKCAIFDILMTITLWVNMVTRQMTSLLFQLCLLVYFSFTFQNLQNSVPWGPLCIMFWFIKYIFTYQRWHHSSLLTQIFFFYIKFSNSCYKICLVSNLIPISGFSLLGRDN